MGDENEMLLRSPLRSLSKTLHSSSSLVHSAATNQAVPSSLALGAESREHVKSKSVFLTSEICDRHDVPDHPECFQRTQVIRERIRKEFPEMDVVTDIKRVTKEQLLLFHSAKHVESITGLCNQATTRFNRPDSNGKSVMINIDGDTTIMEGTGEAAIVAAGAVCHAIDLVMDDSTEFVNAFCGVRPPGHHAEPHQAMGFCFFNNIGIGACHLLKAYSERIKKVLILDFDVHHGNGTQAKFSNNFPGVCFISTHQGQFYPFTGFESEKGNHDNILNVPLAARTSPQAYRTHFENKVLPAMHAFAPDFILVSAGFDAHRLDPLADIKLETDDYYWITKHVTAVAWKYAKGRVVSTLEGGYHLEALAASAAAHVRALREGATPPQPSDSEESCAFGGDAEIDALAKSFAVSTIIDARPELRVTVHFEAKDKLLVLKERSVQTLLQSCKHKFPSLKKKAKTISIQDSHGTVVTDDILAAMAADQHLYLR